VTAAVLDTLPAAHLVQSAAQLEKLVHELGRQTRIAVDTESNSLHAYRERVCLIQFSTTHADYLVDPLALAELQALGAIFANPKIEKIFHAAEYDLICLRRDYDFEFANLFDTMQAGRILGRRQAGLDRLLAEKFGVQTNKRLQKADWGARPLSAALQSYARLDTHFLLPLRDLLKAELAQKGLWALAQEDFQMACQVNGSKPKSGLSSWTRYRHHRELSLRDLTVLNELLGLREQLAASLDRPPFKIIEDHRLIEIAKTRPTRLEELEPELTSRQSQSWGQAILNAVRRGIANPLVKQPAPEPAAAEFLKRLERLKNWRKKAAAEMNVESDVILPRPLLTELAEGGPRAVEKVMARSPWRWQRFGPQLIQVMGG